MIVFASNSTGWDDQSNALVPGGMVDAYIAPILEHLPDGSYLVDRQPHPGALNVYLAVRSRYNAGHREIGKAGVQISHGIADKSYRTAPRARSYDHVVVPGPALARRIIASGVPARKVVQLGYPKLDPLFQGRIGAPARDGRVRVVYAPTHGGGSEKYTDGNRHAPGARATSWWHRDQIMDLLNHDDLDVVTAWHPRHRPDRRATLSEYVGADVVVADGGSTIYEALVLGIPVVLPSWLTRARNLQRDGGRTLEARVYRDRIGYHATAPEQFADLVRRAAEHGQTDQDRAFAEEVLPTEVRGRGGQLHAEWLLRLDEEIPDDTRPPARRHAPAARRARTGR